MKFADRVKGMKASEIRELLKITERPDIISFGGGLPSPDSFPVKEIKRIALKVLKKYGKRALQYGTTEGLTPLRKALIKRMKNFGIECKEDEILITAGSQQSLDLIAKNFLNPRDYVVVELPTYLGALCAFNAYQARYIAIEMDEQGMKTDELKKKLAKFKDRNKAKFIYTVPTFQNPSGITLSLERREHLIEISKRYGIPIVEDDPYRELRYSGKSLPSLKSLDKDVIYVSTFSKILCPGFRLGWVIADKKIIRKLVIAKQGVDLCSNVFCQFIAEEYISSGLIDKHVPKIKKMYKRKVDIMLKALEKHFPKNIRWTKPEGGLFLWITLPKYINTRSMFEEAIKEKVAFVHGAAFFVDRKAYNTMRLNFSNTDDEKIEEGIKRLAKIIKKRMKNV